MISFQTIGQLIVEKNIKLSTKISKKLEGRYTISLNERGLIDESIVNWRAQFITNIGKAVLAQDETEVFDRVTDWATQTGEGAVNHGVAIDELMKTIKLYREVIWDCVEKELEIDNMAPSSILKINRIIGALLDHTAYIFSVSYVKYSTKTMETAQKAFNEISFPVVALSDKVAVLPLIGELNEEKSSVLLENVLQKCAHLRNAELIIDLSGVPNVDTVAANQLFQLAHALNLIGVSPTFTGIRPDIALSTVNLGICFEQFNVKGTLKNALSTNIMF
jgi:rsbT co-antagonist protein RsbR